MEYWEDEEEEDEEEGEEVSAGDADGSRTSSQSCALLVMPVGAPVKLARRRRLKSTRMQAVNHMALRTLLQSKRGIKTRNTGSKQDLFPDSRLVNMLAYLRCASERMTETHLDLSGCTLTTSDFVILGSVLVGHPSLESVDLSHTTISSMAAMNLLEVLKKNVSISHVNLLNTEIPYVWRARIEKQLEVNREAKAIRLQRSNEHRARRRAHRTATHIEKAITSLIEEHVAACRVLCTDEATERLALRDALIANRHAALRQQHRRERRAHKESLVENMLATEEEHRRQLLESEIHELRLLTQVQEATQRHIGEQEQEEARNVIKRAELVAWSAAKRAEKLRREQESADRSALEKAMEEERAELQRDEALAREGLRAHEQQQREVAEEMQAERENREAREKWMQESKVREAREREEWLKKQQELEKDMARTQMQKQREQVLQEEARTRRIINSDADVAISNVFTFMQCDAAVVKCNATLSRGLAEYTSLVLSLPQLAVNLQALRTAPRKCFVNDIVPTTPIPAPPAAKVSYDYGFSQNLIERLSIQERSIRQTLKDLKDANEAASREASRLREKDPTFEEVLGKCVGLLGSSLMSSSVLGSSYGEGDLDTEIDAASTDAASDIHVPLDVDPHDIVVAALVVTVYAFGEGRKAKKLRAKASKALRNVASIYPDVPSLTFLPPAEIVQQKNRIWGGAIAISTQAASDKGGDSIGMEQFFIDTSFSSTAPTTEGIEMVKLAYQRAAAKRGALVHRAPQKKKGQKEAPQAPMAEVPEAREARELEWGLSDTMGKAEVTLPTDGTVTIAQVMGILHAIRYKVLSNEPHEAQAPTARRINIAIRLDYQALSRPSGPMSPADTCISLHYSTWVPVVVTRPYLAAPLSSCWMRYTPGDTCRIFDVITTHDPPVVLQQEDKYTVMKGEGIANFNGSYLSLKFVDGHVADDILLFMPGEGISLKAAKRKELKTAALEFPIPEGYSKAKPPGGGGPYDTTVDMIWLDDVGSRPIPFAEVVKGSIYAKPPSRQLTASREVVFRFHSRIASAGNIRRLLRQLRYANSYNVGGTRTLAACITDDNDESCMVEVQVEVTRTLTDDKQLADRSPGLSPSSPPSTPPL